MTIHDLVPGSWLQPKIKAGVLLYPSPENRVEVTPPIGLSLVAVP